jgi:nitrite reductase/ring-hydroxylating ferredoxin subunit
MLLRHGDGLHAIHDRCSHRGCSLSEGRVDGGAVECMCHGSRFRLDDGSLERGPATQGQPSFEVRETDGRIQVRLKAPAA